MTIPASLTSSPKPVYLLSSDEPLLVRDWLDQARQQLKQLGYEEILSHQVEAGFDWEGLLEESMSLSLFSSLKCHIIRFTGNRSGPAGARFISQLIESPPEDVLFILVMTRLDRAAQNSAWMKKLRQCGEVCELKSILPNQLPGWIQQRAAGKGLQLDQQAALFLADLTEGNLLATDQELEKLLLTHDASELIGVDHLNQAISRSSRYSQYLLTDACLAGKTRRVFKILQGLQLEGVAPIQIQFALKGMLEVLLQLKSAQQLNQLNDQLWRSLNIWSNKQGLYQQALARFSGGQIESFLQSCAKLDRTIKGREDRYPDADWQAVRQLVSLILGVSPVITNNVIR